MKKTSWYIVPYKLRPENPEQPELQRYCAMDDYSQQIIYIDSGKWSEVEILGDRAIVKVLAEETTLLTLDSIFKRLPKDLLGESLSDLSTGVKNALKDEMLDQGYTIQEIKDSLGNDLGASTLRDVLKFMATKRIPPRNDNGTIIFDRTPIPCEDVELIDVRITL